MNELELLKCFIESRDAFEKYSTMYSTQNIITSIIFDHIKDYYDTDTEAQCVNVEILKSKISASNLPNVDMIVTTVDDMPTNVSLPNILDLIKEQKLKSMGFEISQAIHADRFEDATELMTEFIALDHIKEETDDSVYTVVPPDSVIASLTKESLLPIYPSVLNDRLGGGLPRQSQVGIFARPDVGKSTIAVNIAKGLCANGYKVVYFGNEDPVDRMLMRFLCRFSDMTPTEITGNPEQCYNRAMSNGYDNLIYITMAPGTMNDIRRYVKQYQPDAIIVDQIRNIHVAGIQSTAMTEILSYGAQATRAIAKDNNLVSIIITQAGESADDKLVLRYSDVEYSNTGFAAQLDLLIGVGQDSSMKSSSRAILSFPKNKGAPIEAFPIKIDYILNKVTTHVL